MPGRKRAVRLALPTATALPLSLLTVCTYAAAMMFLSNMAIYHYSHVRPSLPHFCTDIPFVLPAHCA